MRVLVITVTAGNGHNATATTLTKSLMENGADAICLDMYKYISRVLYKMVDKAKSLTLFSAKRSEFGEAGKYVSFKGDNGNSAIVGINQDAIDKDLLFAGYNLLVTSETKLKDLDIYNIYHNLWRIEESFRIMKSDLDSRPVFVQREDAIKGHFLICYLTVLLERVFQFKILNDTYSSSEIFTFIKNFKVTDAGGKYINTSANSAFIKFLSFHLNLPLTNFFLSETQIKSIFSRKLKPVS